MYRPMGRRYRPAVLPDAERHARLVALYRSRVAGYEDVPEDYPDRWRRWCRQLLQHGGERRCCTARLTRRGNGRAATLVPAALGGLG
jgi:hypothetical protein